MNCKQPDPKSLNNKICGGKLYFDLENTNLDNRSFIAIVYCEKCKWEKAMNEEEFTEFLNGVY
jgi:uncharacterized cupin superfamily protein